MAFDGYLRGSTSMRWSHTGRASGAASVRAGLAYSYASLGRSDLARRQAELAEQLAPTSTDAMIGPSLELNHAAVLVLVGDLDGAVVKLEPLLSIPAPITRELPRVEPFWDPLRGNVRFQRLVQ